MLYIKHKPLNVLKQIRRAMIIFALIGLFASIYLFITYVFGGPIVCGLVSGCEQVRASQWAYVLGLMPRPALGIIYYSFIILGITWRTYAPHHRRRFWTNVTWIAAFIGFIESGFLTIVQAVDVRAYCIWCLTSAVSATVLFVLSFFDTDEVVDRAHSSRELKFILMSFGTFLVVGSLALYLLLIRGANGDAPKLSARSTPQEVEAALISPTTRVEGPATSTVTIVEYLDYQCPSCGALNPVMKKIRQEYAGRIRFAVRLFPLVEIHQYAKGSAIAAVCAGKQDHFFDYGDALMANQQRLTRDDLVSYAGAFHLDIAAFNACLDDSAVADFVVSERKAADALGLDHTPTIFINGEALEGTPTYEQLKVLIEQRLKK